VPEMQRMPKHRCKPLKGASTGRVKPALQRLFTRDVENTKPGNCSGNARMRFATYWNPTKPAGCAAIP
jgi:hypothetical protein